MGLPSSCALVLDHLESTGIECEGVPPPTTRATSASPRSKGMDQKHAMAEVEKAQTQEAFREGLFVRALGRPCSANPYPLNSNEHALWEKGWRMVDEDGQNVPPSDATSRIKLVPEFTPGVGRTKVRRERPTSLIAIFFPLVHLIKVLRIVAVIAMGILMLIALRW
jgi:hypothetical protein